MYKVVLIFQSTILKNQLLLLFMVLGFMVQFPLFSQQFSQPSHLMLPQTQWQWYNFKKQPKQVGIAYYKSDSLGYEPAMIEVYNFNSDGQIHQKYIRIFGKYGSETMHNYVYQNGILDSINTQASAQNFNRLEKITYHKNGQINQLTSSGTYANYTDTFTYTADGKVATIERLRKNGGSKKVFFDHSQHYVYEKEIAANGKITEMYTIYDDTEVFASFTVGEPIVTLHDTKQRLTLEVTIVEATLSTILKHRTLKQQQPDAFKKLIADLRSKPTTKLVFEIPAEARNEMGDWIKSLQIDRRFGTATRRMVFKKIQYADGTESGSTNYDMIFDQKVKYIQ